MSPRIPSITLLALAISACGNGGDAGGDGGGVGQIGADRQIDLFTGEHIYFGDPDRGTVDTEVALPDAGGGGVTYDVATYENTCRPDATSCTGCIAGTRDYDGNSHTEPHYRVSALLVLYR